MAREVVDPTLARLAAQAGVSYERAEQVVNELYKKEVERQFEAAAAERLRRPGRRPEWYRNFWLMHEVERERAQGMNLKPALEKIRKAHKLSFGTLRKAHEKEKYPTKRRAPNAVERDWRKFFRRQPGALTDLDLREFFRRHPGALEWLRKRELERLQGEIEDLRRQGDMDKMPSRIEDLRRLRNQIEVLRRLEEDAKDPT
jgi:hypothetical protein